MYRRMLECCVHLNKNHPEQEYKQANLPVLLK
jgi:hypothetical protein